jgi:4-amino-4-deoxy-L-arabinose transferase-like glycosyltransferase
MRIFSTKQGRSDVLLIIIAGIIWFSLLGYRDLIDPDEGRYADISSAMLNTGDWVTPRLNGYKFFDKPPIHYWGSAISMAILGETNAAARLWCAGMGFLGALWMWFVGHRLYGELAGRYTFLILLSSILYVAIGHANVLDMGVSVFLALTLGAFALAQSQRNTTSKGQSWMLLSWAGLAGAVLSKGLIGLVFPGAAIVIYSLWQRDWELWRNLSIVKGLSLFLILVLPWFILVSQANEQFLHFFFIHEHFERFTSNVHSRNQPWWYFIAVLSVGFLPWTISIFSAIFKPEFSWRPKCPGSFEASRLFWVYATFIFLFFSYSHSKLVPYILPVFPFLAVLAGEQLAKNKHTNSFVIITGLLAIIVAILAWKIVGFSRPHKPVSIFLEYRPWLIAASISLALASLVAFIYRKKQQIVIPVIALFSLLAFQMGSWGYQSHSQIRSTKLMADTIRPLSEQENLKIYAVDQFEYSLPYYLQRKITVVTFKGNMEFGIGREPGDWIAYEQEFMPLWLAPQHALAILSVQKYKQWQNQNVPMKIVYQDPRRIIVANY